MTYEEAVSYVDHLSGQGPILGLARIEAILKKLGDPQKNLKIIHVAGTNGKGSTCAMLSSILKEAGFCVGMYTSPHLEEYNERYMIDNVKISNEDFALYVNKVKTAYLDMEQKGEELPTVFEFVTAVGFLYFFEKKVDYLLLEVGLGGRFDATNIIENPLLSVIVSIGMDHMEYLGNEITGIAMEKAGIVKKGHPLVLYTQGEDVAEVVEKIAMEKGSQFYYARKQTVSPISQDLNGSVFSIQNEYFSYDKIELSLLGEYQLLNCATVLLVCKALQDQKVQLSEESIRQGIKNACWNGRMEIVARNPLMILDGAHNTDGITMLAKSIEKYFKGKKVTLLIGVLGDKEYTKMIEVLLPLVERVVVTEPNNPRALDVESLKDLVSKYNKTVYQNKQIDKAFETAKAITAPDEVLICAGSLYLIGEIRKILGYY